MLTPLSAEPPVTIIIPAYNYERYIEHAVDSAFSQTYQRIEIIAVDDGSSDRTVELLRRMADRAPCPMEVIVADHGGVCAAMNRGLAIANGELVSILHADDCYTPKKTELQVKALKSDPSAVLAHGEYVVIDELGALVEGLDSSLDRPPARGDALRMILGSEVDVRSMTMMYRADVMRSVGGYDESLPQEDWQSILRLAHAGSIVHVPEVVALRRVHRGSKSVLRYRASAFSLAETAPEILKEVAPPDIDLDRLGGNAVGTLVRSAIAEGNFGRARKGLRVGWSTYPRGRIRMVTRAMPGLVSLLWMGYLQRWLPSPVVARVRAMKALLRGVNA